jgi:ABC-type polysaccharide/polyol phosphate transport system ATPase subunit
MSQAISVEKVSKKFVLGTLQRDTMLRERLISMLSAPFRRRSASPNILWALRDVSFRVDAGEVVGIIGRNGAGKSTLLKVLSKITYPTSGEVHVSGRVASLLEVGTGFHEELTGRENIYLNGSILGMKHGEVAAKMDSMVEFAGVAQFLDTPIKRYSTGMRLRLGFAVAAHLDPDILIVDEVLAVGDAGFQRKCLNAMDGLRSGGRTVLFVSHNMAAVENLCKRTIWIADGRVKEDGDTKEVIRAYLTSFGAAEEQIGHPAQRLNPSRNGSVGKRGLQFVEQVFGGNGRIQIHDSILERWAGSGFSVAGGETGQARAIRLRPCALAA